MFKVNFNSIQSCQNRLSWDLIEKLKATFHFGIKDNKKIQWVTLFHVEVTIRLLSYACNTCTMRHRLFQSHRHTWTDSYLRLLPWKLYLEYIFFLVDKLTNRGTHSRFKLMQDNDVVSFPRNCSHDQGTRGQETKRRCITYLLFTSSCFH